MKNFIFTCLYIVIDNILYYFKIFWLRHCFNYSFHIWSFKSKRVVGIEYRWEKKKIVEYLNTVENLDLIPFSWKALSKKQLGLSGCQLAPFLILLIIIILWKKHWLCHDLYIRIKRNRVLEIKITWFLFKAVKKRTC